MPPTPKTAPPISRISKSAPAYLDQEAQELSFRASRSEGNLSVLAASTPVKNRANFQIDPRTGLSPQPLESPLPYDRSTGKSYYQSSFVSLGQLGKGFFSTVIHVRFKGNGQEYAVRFR